MKTVLLPTMLGSDRQLLLLLSFLDRSSCRAAASGRRLWSSGIGITDCHTGVSPAAAPSATSSVPCHKPRHVSLFCARENTAAPPTRTAHLYHERVWRPVRSVSVEAKALPALGDTLVQPFDKLLLAALRPHDVKLMLQHFSP